MQKYYIRDFLTKELEKNDGKLTQYYVENDHEAIIEREIWDAAQLEINRIKEFKRNHQIRELGSSSLEPFYGKIFCTNYMIKATVSVESRDFSIKFYKIKKQGGKKIIESGHFIK